MKMYYKIWVDAIVKIKNNPLRGKDWKWMVQIYMSIAMAVNLMFLGAVLQRNILHITFYDLEINIFSIKIFNDLISGFIFFLLPPLLINYLLIFKNNKYLELIKNYESNNGKLFFTYFFISLVLPLLILITAILMK